MRSPLFGIISFWTILETATSTSHNRGTRVLPDRASGSIVSRAHPSSASVGIGAGVGAGVGVPTPTSTSSGSAATNVTLLWETSLTGQWYASAALGNFDEDNDGLAYFTSGGDWLDAPYPFWLASGSTDDGSVTWNDTSISPGSVFGTEGDSSFAAFSGIDFTTYATYLSVFQPSSSIPIWADYIVGPTDNVWETGPAALVSDDGSIVAAGATSVPQKNPIGTKNAIVIAARTGFPQTSLLSDAWPNATGLEILRMSADGSILVGVAAIQEPDGSIHTSMIRVYNLSSQGGATTIASFITPYAYAACLSPSGEHLVLATTDSEDRIDTYLIANGAVTPTANSSYPTLPGSFQYIASCRATDAGALMTTFALFWGESMNQSAVASFTLPSSPISGDISPNWLWLSNPVDPSLQDTPFNDAITSDGSVYAYISSGGTALVPGGPVPPTLHLFYTSAEGAKGPFAEVATMAAGNVSASLQAFDMATESDGATLIVFATGQDGHYNIGSYGGKSYAWSIVL